jgi:hypothetical protein
MLKPLLVLELCPGQGSKCKNKQRAITPKLGKAELRSYEMHTYLMISIYLQSFMLIPLIVLELYPGQK